nr:hypothetical protein [Sphingomonas sp. Y57]
MLQRWLFHLGCVLALAWPAFINGQPFYFPDSTAYVRAADSAAYIFSGERIRTEWTEHYRRSLEPGGKAHDTDHHIGARGNDLATESIMAGRSPYFGALLWVSYLFSRFWLFVVAQAAVAYWLIRMALRLFGLARPAIVAGTVLLLSAVTALPYFTGLLMPDLLAGIGILAFLLLVIDRGRLARGERMGLFTLLLLSVVAHLTHILIVAAMAAMLAIWALARGWPRARTAAPVVPTLLILAAGIGSVLLTSAVVEQVFGRKPLLVPLLTARFMADGPGLDYLRRHCPEAGFAACAWAGRTEVMAADLLWSHDPAKGGYMFADAATRRALSAEDKAFATAVLADHPVAQGTAILRNGWRQAIDIEADLLNYSCTMGPHCWPALPPRERAALQASLGGQGLWPQPAIARLQQGAIVAAILLLLAWLAIDARRGGERRDDLRLWLLLIVVALAVNALLGGGISEPQARYQARIIWLLPLAAIIAGLLWRGDPEPCATDG